jgi:tetratricopeptide (TPR) repeat protein
MELDNEKIERLIRDAGELEKAEKFEKALEIYSQTMDILVANAKSCAERAEPAVMEAIVGSGVISGQFLSKFNEHLKQGKIAAVVSNNMGMIFAKMGNKSSARDFFEQAIDLTPAGEIYDDPHIGLEMLKNMRQ